MDTFTNFQNNTKLMQFHTKIYTAGRPNSKIRITIDKNELSQTDNTEFLGLIIYTNLDWNEHVKNVLSKFSSGLFAL